MTGRDQGPRLAPRGAWGTTHRLTAAQAAAVLGVRRQQIYVWAAAGVLSRADDSFGRQHRLARYSHAECVALRERRELEEKIRRRVAARRDEARRAAISELRRRHREELMQLYAEAMAAIRAQVQAEMEKGPSADTDEPCVLKGQHS